MSTLNGASGDTRSITKTDRLTLDSIQEALRMYFEPLEKEDAALNFYTAYRRETMEYDTENMNKYNEDLNTTLIFVSCHLPSIDAWD